MKILLSAIACHPEHGSESAVGWKAAVALAKSHEVLVLTHSDNREGIERYVASHGIKNPSFSYLGVGGPYHNNRLIARSQSWIRYFLWMHESLRQAQLLAGTRSFDLVHHVTYATYRVASPLWKLGLPFVFGPVGGGEKLPWVAAGSMSLGQRVQEIARLMANASARISCKLRQTIRNSSALIASNQATARTLQSFLHRPSAIQVLPVVFFNADHIKSIRSRQKTHTAQRNSLKIFSSGMLEGRKGLAIALHAVRMARDSGLGIEFTIPSRGPEFSYLQRLTQKLGLSDAVHFPDSLPRDEYWSKLLASDIYMAPSLRDNCPATLLEAMLSRCVPIVANCNGPGEIVSPDIGEVVEPARLEKMASEIADRLLRLARNRDELRKKAEAASEYVASTFTESRYLQAIEQAYEQATARPPMTK